MTKEEAYERLELPVGADLHTVRKTFKEMHQDYRMRIDNAFNVKSRQTIEQHLEELKEAYALLNDSDGIDDTADLPRTGRSFEEGGSATVSAEDKLKASLAVFGIDPDDSAESIAATIEKHIADLQTQHDAVSLEAARQVYQEEILKAGDAARTIQDWISTRVEDKPPVEIPPSAEEVIVETPAPGSSSLKFWVLAGVAVFVLGAWLLVSKGGSSDADPEKERMRAELDSATWNLAVRINQVEDYKKYLNDFPEGIFAEQAGTALKKLEEVKHSQKETEVKVREEEKEITPAKESKPAVSAEAMRKYNEELSWVKSMIEVDGCQGCKKEPLCRQQVLTKLRAALRHNPDGYEARNLLNCIQ